MREKLLSRNTLVLVGLALLISLLVIAPLTPAAEHGAKNDGVAAPVPIDPSDVPPDLPIGTQVVAAVDYPSGSDCILAGDTGTVYCYDPDDPELPYLINWDNGCGFEQCQVCGNCAPFGWWVGFSDLNLLCPATVIIEGEGLEASQATALVERGDMSAADMMQTLYRTRDELLSTTTLGKRYTQLYYDHATRISRLLLADAELRRMATDLLIDDLTPSLALLLNGQGDQVQVSKAMIKRVDAFLAALAAADGDGELAKAIKLERAQLNLADLAGLSFADAWQSLNR